jgi:beta-lactamase class A
LIGAAALWSSSALTSAIRMAQDVTYTRPPAPPEPVATAPPRTDVDLQARVAGAAHLSQGLASVAVVDLGTGAEARVDDTQVFPAASLFKVPILVETLKQERQGLLSESTQLEVTQDAWADGSGVLQARIGDRLPVSQLLTLMVQDSDNIAALVLLDQLGVDNVNGTMTALGLHQTQIRDHRNGDDTPHTTSAADMALLFEAIAEGNLFDSASSERALQLLELKQANAWLADGLPFWVHLAHKWGDLPEARHDAGIIYTPQGSYVAVVLTQGARPDEAARAIADVSRASFDSVTGG